MLESPDTHFQRSDVVAEYGSFDFLLPPEEAILSQLRESLAGARVLDVGVGGGRTTDHLSPLTAEYVGVDVSEPMVEACRRKFADRPGVSFLVLDACDMRPLEDEGFDLVLFSFNGLDLVGNHEARLRALAEMRRVCRMGGVVCFSSHNLAFAEATFSYLQTLRAAVWGWPGRRIGRRLRVTRAVLARTRQWRRLNPHRRSLASADHALIVEERPRYELVARYYDDPRVRIRVQKYYVRPEAQVRWLTGAGFGDVRVFAPDGREVTGRLEEGLRDAWWLYYVATRSGDRERPPRGAGDRPAPEGKDAG